MASDIEKSMGEAGKSSTDKVYDTNWCDMPSEVKAKCIGKMEFKERLSLRSTAKAERSLVDSQKIEFKKGILLGELYDGDFKLSLYSENKDKISFKSMKKRLELMKYIWKVGVFELLCISIGSLFGEEEAPAMKAEFIGNTSEISAKNIAYGDCDTDIILYILRSTKNGVESIEMIASANPHPFDDILAIPQVQNAKYWHIKNHDKIDGLHKVAQVWIDNNSEIGSTCQFSITIEPSNILFDEFLEHFADRIVSTSTKRIRIRTDNKDRHILLEYGHLYFNPQFFRFMVISADMKESEYDEDCKVWTRKIDPWYLEPKNASDDVSEPSSPEGFLVTFSEDDWDDDSYDYSNDDSVIELDDDSDFDSDDEAD
ncbi:hypothetical protein B9Z55_008547 [Caenorhabditis nigoni]|uniref:F-box domain-containing protein n=1 Tax=Caenorhabditis nigoni TaxID=1611254 RepID=A0A2G5UN85_9PELO|nr:hypothetical protein B9Z55_008547 [Caenorhabditis nigoni]